MSSESAPLVNRPGGHQRTDEETPKYKSYQVLVYASTFVAYAMSHFSRKCYTNVKAPLHTKGGMSKELLSVLDTSFMFAYAIGSFFSGSLGDRLHPPMVVGVGLLGSAAMVFLLVIGVEMDFLTSNMALGSAFFVGIWIVHGLMQSTGGPVNTAIMGGWFGKKNRGLIFGTWTCHQYIGNIIAALVATAVMSNGYPYMWAVVIPALCNAAWGFWVWTMVPARPADVGLITADAPPKAKGVTGEKLPPPISFIDAFKIPAVAQYAIAFGFMKFINYAMFMWLPFLLSSNFDPSTANVISTLYDIGMMPGGIIVGFVSDLFGGRRACVIITMLAILIPCLWTLSEFEESMPVYALLGILGLMGILVGGPNNIITSAVAADLASHPSIQGNNRALGTVTGIINGSGSITAALGLQAIVPVQNAFGWSGVWYLLIISDIIGMALLMPKVLKEIYHHDEEVAPVPPKAGYQAVKTGTSQV